MRNSVRVFSSDSKHAIQIPPPSLPFHIRDTPLSLAFQSRNAPTPPLSLPVSSPVGIGYLCHAPLCHSLFLPPTFL